MEWGKPDNFAWLWGLPAICLAFILAGFYKRYQMDRFGDMELVQRLITSLNPTKRLIKRILFLLSMLCMILALAQPHFVKKNVLVERKGIDVMIAVDVSQ